MSAARTRSRRHTPDGVRRFFRPNVAAMAGYVPGEQPRVAGVLKLNANENPYPPSPKVVKALRAAAGGSLRLYPEAASDTLRAVAARVYGVGRDHIIAGNGSDELLTILMRCFVGNGDRVAYPMPTYSLYDILVDIQGGVRAPVAYAADFAIPPALARQRAVLTFLCNPNAPSGTLVSQADIVRLAKAVKGILVVDEAYIDFASTSTETAIPLVRTLPNLVVLRTFSKSFSLAGMRIGLGFASTAVIAGMMKVKDSYNLNRLSAAAATAALRDLPWMRRNVRRIQRSRATLTAALRGMAFDVYESQANFVLARRAHTDIKHVHEALKRRKILIRHFDVPGLSDCLRITIGTPDETARVIAELRRILAPKERRRAVPVDAPGRGR
jgi:histidinol-phosphate aminotransferase